MDNPVNWFEIAVADLDRASAFYEAILGLPLDHHSMGGADMAWFPMNPTGAGSAGALVKHDTYEPSDKGTVIYFSVDDIEATLARAQQHGGHVLMPKESIGEFGFVGMLTDSEGNRIGLHSRA